MAVTLTTQGESLIARLQAEGKPLVIDEFIFAHVPGQDHSLPAAPTGTVPDNVVHRAFIPPEFRAFVTPNQVVYSALVGSDIGPFELNWQGLYCREHDTLVAYGTFPTLLKRRYDEATNTPGNNLTRNFILTFTGAQAITGILIEAKVWQLDFTVRLKGIDERERLSNRDIYHRAAFLDDGWKLVEESGRYFLLPGAGYVEGIRIALAEKTEIYPGMIPCDVWLDVCMEPEGSDVVAKATVEFMPPGADRPDYVTPAPYRIPHYLEKIAHIGDGVRNYRPVSGDTFFGLCLTPDGHIAVDAAGHDEIMETRRYRGLWALPGRTAFSLDAQGRLIVSLPS